MLRRGSKGSEVKELQEYLISLGYDLGRWGADGDFGPATEAAVRKFQTDYGLDIDGIVGPQTQGQIDTLRAEGAGTPTGEEGEAPAEGEGEAGTTGEVDAGGGVTVGEADDATTEAEQQTQEGVGAGGEDPATQLHILTGNKMDWYFDSGTGQWYVSYGLPNSDRALVFEASGQQLDALFGTGMRPVGASTTTLQQLTNDPLITFGGNIGEMEGTGSFEAEYDRIIALALDDGRLPQWAEGDPAITDLLFIAQAEGKSQDWLLTQISQTESFQNRFPGIDAIQSTGNLTLADAVTGFLEYEAGVRKAVQTIGGNMDEVTPEVIGGLLGKGFTLETVQGTVSRFDRMDKYAPALNAFNRILDENGLPPITDLQQMFDFVSGQAPSDVYDIWEASSIAEAAQAAGLTDVFTAEDSMKFAMETDGSLSLGEVSASFQEAAKLLLRFRHEVAMEEFGINQDDLIDLSLGRSLRGDTDLAQLSESMNRAVLQAQGSLQTQKAQPFTDFDTQGRAQAASLQSARSSF